MGAYRSLSEYYDELTADVDYSAFAAYYERIFSEYGLKIESILDAACGTGTLTYLLQSHGYDMVGCDASAEMLMQAYAKGEPRPLFLNQSLAELDLYGTVDAAVCSLDGINYLEPEELVPSLSRIRLFLAPGGVFIFDVNSVAKLRGLDGQLFIDETDDVYCVWRAEFDEELGACVYGMDIFALEGELYRRESEEHTEYAYSEQELENALLEAGFTDVRFYGEFSLEPPEDGEMRIFVTARKPKE